MRGECSKDATGPFLGIKPHVFECLWNCMLWRAFTEHLHVNGASEACIEPTAAKLTFIKREKMLLKFLANNSFGHFTSVCNQMVGDALYLNQVNEYIASTDWCTCLMKGSCVALLCYSPLLWCKYVHTLLDAILKNHGVLVIYTLTCLDMDTGSQLVVSTEFPAIYHFQECVYWEYSTTSKSDLYFRLGSDIDIIGGPLKRIRDLNF